MVSVDCFVCRKKFGSLYRARRHYVTEHVRYQRTRKLRPSRSSSLSSTSSSRASSPSSEVALIGPRTILPRPPQRLRYWPSASWNARHTRVVSCIGVIDADDVRRRDEIVNAIHALLPSDLTDDTLTAGGLAWRGRLGRKGGGGGRSRGTRRWINLLWIAADRRDLRAFGLLLDKGADPAESGCWEDGGNMLHQLVRGGHEDVWLDLCWARVEKDEPCFLDKVASRTGETPLMVAARVDNLSACRWLVSRGADIGLSVRRRGETAGLTAIRLARRVGSRRVLEALLELRGQQEVQRAAWRTMLLQRWAEERRKREEELAARRGKLLCTVVDRQNLGTFKRMLAKGAVDLNPVYDEDQHLLHRLVRGRHEDVWLDLCLQHSNTIGGEGGRVRSRFLNAVSVATGETALMVAASINNLNACLWLIRNKASLNRLVLRGGDTYGFSALCMAHRARSVWAVEMLLGAGAICLLGRACPHCVKRG